jgi:DNA (cytosine-5)-methyltransferase 1
MRFAFYEFFCGGGMARLGLGERWRCVFANDIDRKKAVAYRRNFGPSPELRVGDVADIKLTDLPGAPDLVWGSFPCQDLSLAGAGAGLKGERSAAFWPFWKLVRGLRYDGRGPKIVVVENVYGALRSHGGRDFQLICKAFADAGYLFGALIIDAKHFVPQSRPRLFVVGIAGTTELLDFTAAAPCPQWHPAAVTEAFDRLPDAVSDQWVWWHLPTPPRRNTTFADVIEDTPSSVDWHTPEQTQRLLSMMSRSNQTKIEWAKSVGRRVVGGVYRRTRLDAQGRKIQRAEVRFDDVAGCLRTPAGGSSRQTIVVVEGDRVRSRLLSAREAARLMGLPDDYVLPENYNEAYHLAGDGVVVPVVRYLADHVLMPLARMSGTFRSAA